MPVNHTFTICKKERLVFVWVVAVDQPEVNPTGQSAHQFDQLMAALYQGLVIMNQQTDFAKPVATGKLRHQFPEPVAVIKVVVEDAVVQPETLACLPKH